MIPIQPDTFSCNGCGHCCRNLAADDAPAWPRHYHALSHFGVYALPTRGGLGVTSEERARLLDHARRLDMEAPPLRPLLAALHAEGDSGPRLVALAWELDRRVCPFLDRDDRCRIHADRPLACRAFPLRMRPGGAEANPACDAAFAPADGDYARAYPGEFEPAEEAHGFLERALDRVRNLEGRGLLRPTLGASRDRVERLLQAGDVVDALTLDPAVAD